MSAPSQTTQQKSAFSIGKDLLQDQDILPLEEKYQRLMKAYQNVCMERDMLRKAIQVYASYPGIERE
jgi:hypothetical protein